MKILYIAPLPPPITGQSLASQVFLRYLQRKYSVEVVDLSKDSQHDGTVTVKRILAVLKIIWRATSAAKNADRVYLTISESIAGNIKDLVLLALLGRLAHKTVIHLHGGSFGRQILDRSHIVKALNRFYLADIGAAIVSGTSHETIFGDLISSNRVHKIPNFAQDFMFAKQEDVERKFLDSNRRIRVLYISGMAFGKGYHLLLDAYEKLSDSEKSFIQIDFAGKFESRIAQDNFIQHISKYPNVFYHGVVGDQEKSRLFADAHVFCLPTSFLEGQPISILEAYASGCVVLTTPRPGILDIFEPNKNGFLISSDNSRILKELLETIPLDLPRLGEIAIGNRRLAEAKFREIKFCDSLDSTLININIE